MVFTDLTNDPSATQFTFVVTFLIIFFVAALTWTIYSRTTTRRIENKLKQEGYEGMLSWDGNLGIKSIVLAFSQAKSTIRTTLYISKKYGNYLFLTDITD